MKSYLEIKVPLEVNEYWLKELKESLSDVGVHWQNGFYHITVAFIVNTIDKDIVTSIIDDHLVNQRFSYILTLDCIDAFTIKGGQTHIIHMASSQIPIELSDWISSIRKDLTFSGVDIEPDFKFHVTLGRVPASNLRLDELRNRISSFDSIPITIETNCLEYREFRGNSIKKWDFS